MTCVERAIAFTCAGISLVGIVSSPVEADSDRRKTGVVIVVGGPQYRAGSHRMFVLQARALARAGFTALRFDHRGVGDSGGALRTFESIGDDIDAAISALQAADPELTRFVLWGLCDAASAALLYVEAKTAHQIAGLCLFNPWVRSSASLARTHVKHYYGQRLLQGEFWKKLFSGNVGIAALKGFASSLFRSGIAAGKATDTDAIASYQGRMAAGWRKFPGRILLCLSGKDLTAKEFSDMAGSDPVWSGCISKDKVTVREFPDADHTLSARTCLLAAERHVIAWLEELTEIHDEA